MTFQPPPPPQQPPGQSATNISVQSKFPIEQLDVRTVGKEKIRELYRAGRLPAADQVIEEIMSRALKIAAYDVHFESTADELRIRFGHEGVMKNLVSLPMEIMENLMNVIKQKASLNLFEKKRPQEGRFSATYGSEQYDFRVSVMPVLWGERAAIRILHKSNKVASLYDLGFSADNLEKFKNLIKIPKGLLIVTGPAGSGKSSTAYAATVSVYTPEKCIITVEDPVEYKLPFASQVQLPLDKAFNFVDALRAILRQNPNVIMLGEIRDAETGIVASEAALTGNLVITTMLADDAVGAIHKLLNLGVQPYWLASTLVGVVYQQLIRKICDNCKEEYKLTPAEYAMLGSPSDGTKDLRFFRGKGCDQCQGTGYKGRTAIHEIVTISPEMRDMILEKASAARLKAAAVQNGFHAIRTDAVHKVAVGVTTVQEFARVLS